MHYMYITVNRGKKVGGNVVMKWEGNVIMTWEGNVGMKWEGRASHMMDHVMVDSQ